MPLTTFQTAAGIDPNSISNNGGYSSVGSVSTGTVPLATSANTNTIQGNTNYSSAIYGMTELTPDTADGTKDSGVISGQKPKSYMGFWIAGAVLLVAVGIGIYFLTQKTK